MNIRAIDKFRNGILAVFCVFLVDGTLLAEETQRVVPDAAATQQKYLFVQKLVTQSVAVQTIESSGDADAIAKLKDARVLVSQAQQQLKSEQHETANETLDRALALVTTEARRLSQAEVKAGRERDAYGKRLQTVEAFMKAYERVSQEKKKNTVIEGQLADIRSVVESAKRHAANGDHAEAIALLDQAYNAARGDIREFRDGETLTRSLDFKSAAEEYEYEHRRNESHFVLLQFAISEKAPPATRKQYIDKLREDADSLRDKAEKEAEAGNHAAGVQQLVESTDTLLKAIRMTGLYIPG